ncbi:hypothetical protein QBC46DRAFT_350048 [Diplogelasinospora grovesii]|uniref:ATP-dependent DNA ligase family profile domain-containing protein n=1 Tax=Diplogelasinospora grovesii TaxID=303347 RepID=A0AAN6NHE2_9PEZI|nr:hypothetical protein QBC46DRAFT_350048 [Diplogelasinospora grovesii]
MPFRFSYVCDLLQRLEDNINRGARTGLRSNTEIIREWFERHRPVLLYRDDHDAAALLSTLLPEKRSDRVYLIREKRLQSIVGRALGLGRCRIAQLGRWEKAGSGVDLADCAEAILKETPNPVSPTHQDVTVEEIDGILHSIASVCRFSSPAVRRSLGSSSAATQLDDDREDALGNLYRRLSARDAKWLTRLILKNYEPVVLDPQVICYNYHPLLPAILKVQDDFAVAGAILRRLNRERTVTGPPAGRAELAKYLKPSLGIKVGRQPWFKGRSIKHCLDMSHGRMSCEEKMDGEYCQIHIDLSKGPRNCIQIFSKSGKDSTEDRAALHDSIRKSLKLGEPSCPIRKGCILEGELVVYSDKDGKILDFHKIRKHVSRSGSFLGIDKDSQRHPWEHLLIVYYDVLMVDDESLLAARQSERFRRLKELVTVVQGRSALVERVIIDCDTRSAASDLRRAFASCITARKEGLVLKPDDPYFDFDSSRRPYSCCAIKLKKEYIGSFGEIGDFAVVGARYDAVKAKTYSIPNLQWTHFYVGCLENKDEVQRWKRQPRFIVTNVVELNATQLKEFITSVNPVSVPDSENDTISLRVDPGVDNGKRPSVIFPEPPVFDLRCFSFDKQGNTGFWSPRFPMVSKIHCDRTYHDGISFSELQEMAAKERDTTLPEDSQELLGWIAALEGADPRGIAVDAVSQLTTTSTSTVRPGLMTPSPTRSAGSQRALLSPTSPMTDAVPRLLFPSPTSRQTHSLAEAVIPAAPLITPPTSSDVQPEPAQHNNTLQRPVIPTETLQPPEEDAVIQRKRPSPPESPSQKSQIERQSKLQKRGDDHQTPESAPTSRSPNSRRRSPPSSPTQQPQREPLINIGEGSSRRNTTNTAPTPPPQLVSMNSMYEPSLSYSVDHEQPRPSAFSKSFHGTGTLTKRPQHQSETSSSCPAVIPSSNNPTTAAGADTIPLERRCRYRPETCLVSTYSFLLSPCIANYLWVTEDLLGCHGVTDFHRDPRDWTHAQPSTCDGNNTQKEGLSGERGERKRKKKVVLVDSRRKEATDAFLRQIQEAELKKGDGRRREYVPVFDWRVLEELQKEEDGGEPGGGGGGNGRERERFNMKSKQGIWRRHWVGLA